MCQHVSLQEAISWPCCCSSVQVYCGLSRVGLSRLVGGSYCLRSPRSPASLNRLLWVILCLCSCCSGAYAHGVHHLHSRSGLVRVRLVRAVGRHAAVMLPCRFVFPHVGFHQQVP